MVTNVLCVGTELLLGQIEDTNSGNIGRMLANCGIDSYEQRKVGDNFGRIKLAMISMLENCDSIIIAGGLGPTHDDITREVAGDLMGVELVLNTEAEENMRKIFANRKREMPIINLRQAMVPQGATIIPNKNGTAPGLICPVVIGGKTKYMFLVPGFPYELKPMVQEVILPFILNIEKRNTVILNRTLKTWGIPESELSETLDEIIQDCETGDVKVGFLARGINGIYIKISTKAKSLAIAKNLINEVEEQIQEKIANNIYADEEETMESKVLDLLHKRKATLAIAESFTGGLVSSRIVEIPGASNVFKGSLVAYSKEIKNDILDIEFDDVYSSECAVKMARSTLEKFNVDFAISTTGVSGPGDEIENDVIHKAGECYIALAHKDFSAAYSFNFGGDRQRVREYGTISALNILREYLEGKLDETEFTKSGKTSE